MSMTKAQRRKQSKKKNKQKQLRRAKNIRQNNLGAERWVLQILLDGVWRQARTYRTWASVEAHREETEERRANGEVIVPGKVFDMETGKEVMSIEGSDKKGALPDKLAGNEAAENKVKTGFLKRMIGNGNDSEES